MSHVCTEHIFFIHESVDRHLDYFRFSALVNNAVMNMVNRCLLEFLPSVLLGIYPGVELLGYKVVLCLTFSETADCFPQGPHRFPFPSAMHEGSDFTFSPTLVRFLKKPLAILVGTGEVCICLITNDGEHLFMCLLVTCVSSLET